MLIDYRKISADALKGVVLQYVEMHLSETDTELNVEQWASQVIKMVKKGELLVEFSEIDESVYLKKADEIINGT